MLKILLYVVGGFAGVVVLFFLVYTVVGYFVHKNMKYQP